MLILQDNQLIHVDRGTDVLEHYGVKGMRWGKRIANHYSYDSRISRKRDLINKNNKASREAEKNISTRKSLRRSRATDAAAGAIVGGLTGGGISGSVAGAAHAGLNARNRQREIIRRANASNRDLNSKIAKLEYKRDLKSAKKRYKKDIRNSKDKKQRKELRSRYRDNKYELKTRRDIILDRNI